MSHSTTTTANQANLNDTGLLLLILFLAVLLLVFGPCLGALIAVLVLSVIYIITVLFWIY